VKLCKDKDLKFLKFTEIAEHIPMMKIILKKSSLGEYSELQVNEEHEYKLYLQGY
jgi:hypothetical protein